MSELGTVEQFLDAYIKPIEKRLAEIENQSKKSSYVEGIDVVARLDELQSENAELRKQIDKLESERRTNALDGQAEIDIRGIELDKYKRLVEGYDKVIDLAKTKDLYTVQEYYWHKWDEIKKEVGL